MMRLTVAPLLVGLVLVLPAAAAGLVDDASEIVVSLLPGASSSSAAGSAASVSCGGIAPKDRSCSAPVEADPGSVVLGVRAEAFTGTVQAKLVDAEGDSVSLTCNYVAGTVVRVGPIVVSSGCSSSSSGTMNAGALTLVGTVAGTGLGPWEVYVQ